MLGTVISSLIAKVTSFLDLCLAVVSQMMTLCRTIIAVGIDRMILIAQYIKSQYVALKLNIKPCLAQLTNQVLLIKVGIMNVLHKVWTGWTTTSNNCTPDPPTCIESVETRQLTCSPGFEGLSQEQRTSICSDPYGSANLDCTGRNYSILAR
jgi:hypothetical protein